MARMLKSVVTVPIVKEPYYIIANDRLIGSQCDDSRVKVLSKAGAGVLEVGELAINHIHTLPPNKVPLLLLSAGSEDISEEHANIEISTVRGDTDKVRDELVDTVIKNIVSVGKKVRELGGKMIVTSLIPRPREQSPEVGINRHKPEIQEILSDAYVAINNRIYRYNKNTGESFPNIKSALEKTGRQGAVYEGRDQSKIVYNKFLRDLVHIKNSTRVKMMRTCVRHLIHIRY